MHWPGCPPSEQVTEARPREGTVLLRFLCVETGPLGGAVFALEFLMVKKQMTAGRQLVPEAHACVTASLAHNAPALRVSPACAHTASPLNCRLAVFPEASACVHHTAPVWKCSVRWVSVRMLGPDRIRPVPCVSSCELCTEPSGSPASGFQDSMRTLAEAVTKGLPMVCVGL